MTKADIVSNISDKLGVDRADVQATVEKFMKEVKISLEKGENVYLRGFGSFIIKTRAEKTGRNIPSFKPAKIFVQGVKSKVPVSK
jgi:DNA-binding protein HU-beta